MESRRQLFPLYSCTNEVLMLPMKKVEEEKPTKQIAVK
jgi:hypothetical protein